MGCSVSLAWLSLILANMNELMSSWWQRQKIGLRLVWGCCYFCEWIFEQIYGNTVHLMRNLWGWFNMKMPSHQWGIPSMERRLCMMTSWYGNIFCITGHLCGESPVNSPHKGQWRGALMFTLICARIKGWVNNCEAGDLRHHRGHYDVIVMAWNASHLISLRWLQVLCCQDISP